MVFRPHSHPHIFQVSVNIEKNRKDGLTDRGRLIKSGCNTNLMLFQATLERAISISMLRRLKETKEKYI